MAVYRRAERTPMVEDEAIITDQSYAPLSRRFVRHRVHASSLEGDLILDPCCGTGTVGRVAGKLKRRFIGIEVDEATCHLARARVGWAVDRQRWCLPRKKPRR